MDYSVECQKKEAVCFEKVYYPHPIQLYLRFKGITPVTLPSKIAGNSFSCL